MITVCCPTYNSAKTIRQAVASVGEYPILIYDNESTDGTDSIIKNLGQTKTVRRNNSRSRNFNTKQVTKELLKDVITEYVFFLDSDVVLREKIAMLVPYLSGGIGMVGLGYGSNSNHTQMGATLFKTEIAKKIDFTDSDNCACGDSIISLKKMKLDHLTIEGGAIHLKGGAYASTVSN
jgi:glycosyltransferase involved in cell wall biosynthesis